ncbi:MAG: branched-chain amino acid ABC transporter permease [Haloglomus sp.]
MSDSAGRESAEPTSALDSVRNALEGVHDAFDTGRDRLDSVVTTVPGNTAGIGVLLFVTTLLLLASGIPLAFPPQLFRLLNQLNAFAVYGLVLVGLNMQFGDTGIVNFGPVLFFGAGAYGTAVFTAVRPTYGMGLGMPLVVGIAAGILFAMLIGGFIGLSTLRLRGDYLAMTTLAAAEIFRAVVRSYSGVFGGNKGISSLPKPVQGLAVNNNVRFLGLTLFLLSALLIAYEGFRRLSDAPYGRVLRAILSDEDAARSVGKDTFVYKMQVFVYGAAIAGLGGSLWVLFQGSASPAMVSIDITILLWLGMMLGGPGNYRGVIGGLAAILLFRLLFSQTKGMIPVSAVRFNALRPVLFGLLFVLIIRYRPAGIWGESERLEVFK